jgi:hypothetical protein
VPDTRWIPEPFSLIFGLRTTSRRGQEEFQRALLTVAHCLRKAAGTALAVSRDAIGRVYAGPGMIND